MARLDPRADEDHRSADQSHRAWRERVGRLPHRDPVDGGLRVFRQADGHRLGCRAHGAGLGRSDEAPWLHEIRGARRRLGCAGHGSDGSAGGAGIDRHSLQHAGRRSTRYRQSGTGGRPGAVRSLSRRKARVRPAGPFLYERPRLRARDGKPPTDAVRDCGFTRSALRRG